MTERRWAEVELVVVPAEQRAQTLPSETRRVDYLCRVAGTLIEGGVVGQRASVLTPTGRTVTGHLVAVDAAYGHGFGRRDAALLALADMLQGAHPTVTTVSARDQEPPG